MGRWTDREEKLSSLHKGDMEISSNCRNEAVPEHLVATGWQQNSLLGHGEAKDFGTCKSRKSPFGRLNVTWMFWLFSLPILIISSSEADGCKISIHAEERLMMRGFYVVRVGFQSVKGMTQQWGGRGNGFWHPDHWADVLHYAGKTKGQGQAFRWMS